MRIAASSGLIFPAIENATVVRLSMRANPKAATPSTRTMLR